MGLGAGPESTQSAEKATILVSSGEFASSRVHGTVAVYAKPDTIAAKFLEGRLITKSHDPDLRQIKSIEWLKKCQSSHERCGGTLPQLMPTRIIDLRDPKAQGRIRLKVNTGQHDRYLALSYSWGLGLRHNVKLKRETLEPYQDYIPEQLMTRSHQEALRITRELGYHYLWIDALCIIQGDTMDWEAEACKIAQVYSNAELTIVAGRSDDSAKGFLQLIEEPLLPPQPIPYHRPKLQAAGLRRFGKCFLALNRSIRSGPVDERAWCFQESVLSRRMIVYGMQQLSFKCREICSYEDGSYIRYKWSDGGRYDLSSPLVGQGFSQEDILSRWYQLTQEYSYRDVYDPTDNFAALAGVALRFHDALKSAQDDEAGQGKWNKHLAQM
ncbi:hypothetical protein DDE82_008736 [Stemphylium lycopersici]|uniref:Heterokaryon incompatibility domain-containing protein n=1 Tax=Stemphylium lycopersici TaxID=183478 RepID=A0A364MSX4_STELY|nr:hypothetical protein DDE82_008736 [Stemphylium lycopersici]RAR02553.1 hypothetical protein DDE83_008535 [Stemphylium lycopersici]